MERGACGGLGFFGYVFLHYFVDAGRKREEGWVGGGSEIEATFKEAESAL